MNRLQFYKPQYEMRWSYRLVTWSILLTFALFVFIPIVEKFLSRSDKIKIRTIESIDMLKPPPKLPPLKKENMDKSKPKLRQNKQLLSLIQIEAAFNVEPGDGDFALNFDMNSIQDTGKLVFELSAVEKQAQVIYRVTPIYPMAAKIKKISGEVVVEFVVTAEGKTEQIKIVKAEPVGVFEKTVLQAVKKWRFKPSRLHDRPVASRILLPLQFNLD